MKRRFQIVLWVGLFIIFFFITPRLLAQEGPRLDIKEHHLKNGLQVLILEDHAVPVVTVQVWCRAGSRNERPGISGVSHVLEHMMFKGTKKRGPEEYSEIIQRHGGIDNAFTSNDMTAYYSILPSSQIELAFDLEGDRFTRPVFREFLPERDVVKEERRLGENDPQDRLYEELQATAFKAHPYGSPVIGWMSDLDNLTVEDLETYFQSYYSPSNLTLVVVGDVEEKEALRLAKKYFGKIKKREAPPSVRTVEPEQLGEKRVEVHREARLPVVAIAYHIPEFTHPKAPTFQVISRILASGESSRLYQRLVYEEQIATHVYGEADLRIDPGIFLLWSMVSTGHTGEDVEKIVYEEIEKLKKEPVSDRELKKAINQEVTEFIFDQESVLRQAFTIGWINVLGSYEMVNEVVEKMRGVTKEDIMETAKEFFTEKNRTVATLVPELPENLVK